MFNFFKRKQKPVDIKEIIEKQIDKNMDVLTSLRDYDQGKKDISTAELERSMPDIRVTP
jgi:hypothetical protein